MSAVADLRRRLTEMRLKVPDLVALMDGDSSGEISAHEFQVLRACPPLRVPACVRACVAGLAVPRC